MIRAIRPNAMARDDASLVTGWNVAPNVAYILALLPGAASCGVYLYDEDGAVLIAFGAALAGTDQPCVLIPQTGQTVDMVDAALGWHLLLTTTGIESQRAIRIGPAVDLPDEIHTVYGDDGMALARATAAIDAAAHYIDDVTVTCTLGLGAGLGDVVSVPVDGSALVGQVEGITWTATPDGTPEQAVVRRYVAIAADAFEEVTPPTVADDTGSATHTTGTSGNLLTNDASGLTVTAVNGLSSNVGHSVSGNNGGVFTVAADGAWTFDPDGDFALLSGAETANTSVTYHASDGTAEAMGTLTVNISHANTVPVALDDTGSTTADATISGNVLTNDTDVDLDSLTVEQVAGGAENVGATVVGSNGGLFTISSTGAWTFDPNSDFDSLTGEQTATTSVTYRVSDGHAYDDGTLTVTVRAAPAGIQLVGVSTGIGNYANYAVQMPPDCAAGDLVIVFTGFASLDDKPAGVVSPSGYIELVELYVSETIDPNFSVSYKILGESPETSIIVAGSNTTARHRAATTIIALRGVDQSSPFDVPYTSAGGANSANANPPAITPITPGALVIASAGWTAINALATPAYPSGYDNLAMVLVHDGNTSYSTAVSIKEWDGAGPEDPGTYSTADSVVQSGWCAVTLAIRPA